MLKRLFDVVFSFLALLCLLPVFIITALLIKLDSYGPVFYKGTRVGRHGKLFKILKFRTMADDSDKRKPASGGYSVADDDPRITKVGLLLRTFKINELPQLINVLLGDMSFVGPRPEVSFYVNMFTEEEKAILTARPGLTDWASLQFNNEGEILKGSPDPEKTYMEKIRPEKLRLQLEYVKKGNLLVDMQIIFDTFKIVMLDAIKRGA